MSGIDKCLRGPRMGRERRRPAVAIAGLLALVLAGPALVVGCGSDLTQSESPGSATPAAYDPALAGYYEQQLDWKPCGHGFMCSRADVPLNYAEPDGERLSLSLIRLPAADPDRRIGSLFVNPGGPGVSGVRYAQAARNAFDQDIRDRFDVVGFDPRGVGDSAPIRCLSDAQTDRMLAMLGRPDSRSDAHAVAAEAASFGRECLERSPALTPQVGTASVVRDLDILRQLAGDERLNFLGRSYGTFIGAKYAARFPHRVGRFVLDGAITPTLTLAELARGQAEGFELALGRFVADCLRRSDCPLPRKATPAASRQAGLETINQWLRRLAKQPLRAGDRDLTRPLAEAGLMGAMYEPSYGWPQLRRALRAGFSGNARPMIEMVDDFFGREPDGQYSDNAFDALYAVNCVDHDDRVGVDETSRLANEWSRTAPTFGAFFAWGNLPCGTWPAPPTERPEIISADGSRPILVIGTTFDPATPFRWSEELAGMLANASLLVWESDGHTAYRSGSDCVDSAADKFLLTGQLPPDGQRC